MLRRIALFRLHIRARVLRDRAAQYQLAELYATGEHRDYTYPKNELRAAALYRMASERGCHDAMYELGFMYLLGEGVTKDKSTALVCLSRAGNGGHAEAMRLLGDLYTVGNHGVPVDSAEATRWRSLLFEHLARHPEKRRRYEQEGT
jgi:TPR repeat protein